MLYVRAERKATFFITFRSKQGDIATKSNIRKKGILNREDDKRMEIKKIDVGRK